MVVRFKRIANLTQHLTSKEQFESGVFNLHPDYRRELRAALTFEELPDQDEIVSRALKVAGMVPDHCDAVMIGGAGWFMPYVHRAIVAYKGEDFPVLSSFSLRRVVEEVSGDGFRKVSKFVHLGWIRWS